MLKQFWAKIKDFATREEGSELMQWAIIIVIVAVLAGVAYGISQSVTGKLQQAQQAIDGIPAPSAP